MSEPTIVCGHCGATNPPGSTFCGTCGVLLAAYQAPTGAHGPDTGPSSLTATVAPPPADARPAVESLQAAAIPSGSVAESPTADASPAPEPDISDPGAAVASIFGPRRDLTADELLEMPPPAEPDGDVLPAAEEPVPPSEAAAGRTVPPSVDQARPALAGRGPDPAPSAPAPRPADRGAVTGAPVPAAPASEETTTPRSGVSWPSQGAGAGAAGAGARAASRPAPPRPPVIIGPTPGAPDTALARWLRTTPPQTIIMVGVALVLLSCVLGLVNALVNLPLLLDALVWGGGPIGFVALVAGLILLANRRAGRTF